MPSPSSSETRARRASSLSPCSQIKRRRSVSGIYVTDEMRSPSNAPSQDCPVSPVAPDSPPPCICRQSYLDVLSSEAVHNIVRHMSSKPRHRNWRSFVETSSLLALYRAGGHISEVCMKLFRDVTVCAISSGGGENGDFVVRNMNDVANLMDFAGPFLNKVTFAALPQDLNSCSVQSNVHPLAFKCGSIKTLDLVGVYNDALFNRILKECRRTLESLYVSPRSNENIKAMVRNCGTLRDLELFISDENFPDFSSIWASLGSRLEKLKVCGSRKLYLKEIQEIQTHCRKLRHVDIPGYPKSVADLIVSYGDQLEYARFRVMGAKLYGRIMKSCPNVICSATVTSDLVAVAQTVGPKLKELNIGFIEGMSLTGLDEAMQHCSNLKTICVEGLLYKSYAGLISGFFSSPKPQLESLQLWGVSDSSFSDSSYADDLGCIAASTGGLRDFTLSCIDPPPKVFLALANSNPLLERVDINLRLSAIAKDSMLVDILETFSVCPLLRELFINSLSKVPADFFNDPAGFKSRSLTNAYNRYRFKKTHVCVFENELFS